MSSDATPTFAGKQISISDFQNFVDTVAYPEYIQLLRGLPDHSMNVERQKEYLRRVKSVCTKAGEFIEKEIFPHIRYITADNLISAITGMAGLLKDYYKTHGKKVALIVSHPLVSSKGDNYWKNIWTKSNVMMSLILAKHLAPDAILVDRCFYSKSMLEAVCDDKYEYLIVDDCIYSGTQIRAIFSFLTERGWAGKTFAVVPFVHNVDRFRELLHPAVYASVAANSKQLSSISEADKSRALRLGLTMEGLTLTYLQTKMPDFLSVTRWVLHGGNPFSPRLLQFREFQPMVETAEYVSLMNGCDSYSGSDCPEAKYKKLQNGFGLCADKHIGGAKRRARSRASKSRKRSKSGARRRRQRRG